LGEDGDKPTDEKPKDDLKTTMGRSKSQKNKKNKEEMRAALEAKEEEQENWRYFSKVRPDRFGNLEPTLTKVNKFAVVPAGMIPDDVKNVMNNIDDRLKDEGIDAPPIVAEQEEQDFKRIEFKLLEFDWIFRGESAKMFIEELAQTSNDNIFQVESIQVGIRFLWDFYQPEIIKKIYIPYMVYFLCFVIYASFIFESAIGEVAKYIFAVPCIGYSAYILYMEVKQFFDQGKKYFEMPSFIWNFIDILSSWLVILFVVMDVMSGLFSGEGVFIFMRAIASITVFLLWLKFFTFLRIFNSFSAFIRMIIEMFKDMAIFMAMLILGVLSFANAFYILDQHKPVYE
jgi:hypothetical protein